MIEWKRSTRCDNSGPNCVEVAFRDGEILVRHSDHPEGPYLRFSPAEWSAFTGGVRDGEFDL